MKRIYQLGMLDSHEVMGVGYNITVKEISLH